MCERGFENLFMLSGGERASRTVLLWTLKAEIGARDPSPPLQSLCPGSSGFSTGIPRAHADPHYQARIPVKRVIIVLPAEGLAFSL